MSAARAAKAEGRTLRVRQIRSGIGFDKTQKATLRAMGLEKLGRVRVLPDNPQVRGMIAKVSHLVTVEQGEGEA
jgi:large subunit ribosomal protein L30